MRQNAKRLVTAEGKTRCSGTKENPFEDAHGHFNPDCCDHPHHAGDLPPLLGNRGYALQIFLTGRFCVSEIIGKTVIIHADPDDFTSQPSGNSGKMIACGQIREY
ncbi:MAG: superoxide dismutase family protein [Anaerovoracaceae bacterium]|nr:superoxide dismutase family protein [Bacillota bacterium]MDY5771238.1 superoxide dismutase family protein [Anaerovoracaceae bacterium]